ncbi:bifunctional metallophosphatase/5'-nucleotidase [Candidatus Riflebacteria bacterium]
MRIKFCLISLFLTIPIFARNIKVSIFHTTDIHGYVFPYINHTTGKEIGSFASMVPILERYRKAGRAFLFLDTGDIFQGTLEDEVSKGGIITRIMNEPLLGYTARGIGNHDFDYGASITRVMAKRVNFPIICTNIHSKGSNLLDYKKDYLLVTAAGFKFGIFALLSSHTPLYSFPENIKGITFQPEEMYIKKMTRKLRNKGADFIILLSHVGFLRVSGADPNSYTSLRPGLLQKILDQDDADFNNNIDIIVDGHSHNLLYKEYEENPATKRDNTYLAQAGNYGEYLGELELNIDRVSKSIQEVKSRFHHLEVEKNQLSEKFLNKYRKERLYSAELNDGHIASTTSDFLLKHHLTAPFQSDLAAFAVARAFFGYAKSNGMEVDLALVNNPGIRYHLFSRQGRITREAIHKICPFKNKLVKFSLSGKDLLDVFADNGRMLTYYGAKMTFIGKDFKKTGPGIRPVKLVLLKGEKMIPVKPEAEYTVVTPSFLAQTGEFLIRKLRKNQEELKGIDQEALSWYLQKISLDLKKQNRLLSREYFADMVKKSLEIQWK